MFKETTEIKTSEFVVSRDFNAPQDLVFKAWTEADRLKEWWGPKGFSISIKKFDLSPDGIFLYFLNSNNGAEMWGRFIFREIKSPDRIVFVSSFSDAGGGITRAPFSELWPLEILNIVTFSETDGKTSVTIHGGPIKVTEAEQQMFESMFDSMKQGFAGTFDQLSEYLATLAATNA